jgi:hypothetical protein
MGKRSKTVKRALPKAYKALRQVISMSGVYFNGPKMVRVTEIARAGLPKKFYT